MHHVLIRDSASPSARSTIRHSAITRLVTALVAFLLAVCVSMPAAAQRSGRAGLDEETDPPGRLDVVASLNEQASRHMGRRQYAQARSLYERSLAIRKKALGPGHPLVATSLDALAALHEAQGRYAQAEPLYEQALAIREATLPPGDYDLCKSMDSLAAVYRNLGKHAAAESLYKRSLADTEGLMGPDHPAVAEALNNLALLYQAQGLYALAEPTHLRAIAVWEGERSRGPDGSDDSASIMNVHLATSLNSLGDVYFAQGKYEQAQSQYTRALAIRRKALDPYDPDLATSFENLARVLRKTNPPPDEHAEELERRAAAIRARTR